MDTKLLGVGEEFTELRSDIRELAKLGRVDISFDLETFNYNTLEGRKNPQSFKSLTYCLGVGYEFEDVLKIAIYPNFYFFLEDLRRSLRDKKSLSKIDLIHHNGNRYDNHFLRQDLIYYYNITPKNLHIRQAIDEGNSNSVRLIDSRRSRNETPILLERRVKSRVSLDIVILVDDIEIHTIDNYPKTNSSIDTLGAMLYKKRYITAEDMKGNLDYEKNDLTLDLTEEQARGYAMLYFNRLKRDKDAIKYVCNDIKILHFSKKYYGSLFLGFDYSKITYTQNILERYRINKLADFQLLNIYENREQGRNRLHLKYTDYKFSNLNLYDYLKRYYKGGLNFYNPNYIAKTIRGRTIALDINSSYPYAMHNFKIPTFLEDFREYEEETLTEIVLSDDTFTLYEIEKSTFDLEIIYNLGSSIVQKMLVKYYNNLNDFVYLNSTTFRMLKDLFKLEIREIKVKSYLTFSCYDFGAKHVIEQFYRIKEQASSKHLLEIDTPYTIRETNKINEDIKTEEEVYNAKVHLNGLYGLPALRSHFNLFRYDGENFYNVINGYKNSERNILFSLFVTSIAFYNLLSPFIYFTDEEIDKYFYYCDTDSIFIHEKLFSKIPKEMIDPHNLGAWSIDEDNIINLHILNHKKYAYQRSTGEIIIKCAGVPSNSFNSKGLSFDEFIEDQFTKGVKIKTLRSIFNASETITIYNSQTELHTGTDYPNRSYNKYFIRDLENIFKEVRETHVNDAILDDAIYLETYLGSFGIQDVFNPTHEGEGTLAITHLYNDHKTLKPFILYT